MEIGVKTGVEFMAVLKMKGLWQNADVRDCSELMCFTCANASEFLAVDWGVRVGIGLRDLAWVVDGTI